MRECLCVYDYWQVCESFGTMGHRVVIQDAECVLLDILVGHLRKMHRKWPCSGHQLFYTTTWALKLVVYVDTNLDCTCLQLVRTCMHTHTCTHAHSHTHSHTRTCTHTHTHARTHAHTKDMAWHLKLLYYARNTRTQYAGHNATRAINSSWCIAM